MRYGIEFMESKLVVRANIYISSFVFRAVAVPRCRKYCRMISGKHVKLETHTSNALPIMLFFVAFHPDFMASNNSIQPIVFAESLCDIRTKLHTHASLARPSARFGLGISPQHF